MSLTDPICFYLPADVGGVCEPTPSGGSIGPGRTDGLRSLGMKGLDNPSEGRQSHWDVTLSDMSAYAPEKMLQTHKPP